MPRDASEKSWFYGIFFREVPYRALQSFLATGHSWLVLTCVDLGSPRLSFGLGLPCALSLAPCDAASRYEFGVSCSTFFCTNLTPPGPEFHPPVGGVELWIRRGLRVMQDTPNSYLEAERRFFSPRLAWSGGRRCSR